MRLLRLGDSGKLTLTNHDHDKLPPYAILSHTWGGIDDEVSFDDVQRDIGKDKAGYAKIMFCGEQALKDDLTDFWVDTCCIKKTDSSELSEAIISMFRWYRNAAKCYVYLSDVSTSKRDYDSSLCDWKAAFRQSRWFTRGWTLQELLAPKEVQFWSRDGHFLGTKDTLKNLICQITGISERALLGAPTSGIPTFEKMRWAAQRDTKKEEDRFYSLFGIFDISLPVLYGEGGVNARERFMIEIERKQGPVRETTNGNLGTETCREDLLALLAFDQMDSRHATIKEAQRTTCDWLLQHPDYLAWNSSQRHSNGILWIAGKPGAGKSTLIKFALACARKNMTMDGMILDFFFNARGEDLEKTTLGMYRALLFQLLNQAPDLQEVLDHNRDVIFRGSRQVFTWELGTLQTLLREAVRKLGPRRLKLFIDALDECDEKQVREMVEDLEDLVGFDSQGGLSVCFASRHYPTIEVRHSCRLVLEDEEGHAEDLSKYIKRRLKAGSGKKFDQVREKVRKKANGVFMWVVLVVEILNDEFRRGRIFAVEKRLQDIPSELSELFKDILRRDRVNIDDLLLCLQWILFAKRPLSRAEFYFAMEAGLHSSERSGTPWQPQPWIPEEITDEDMNRFVLHSSKGLAELTKSKKAPTVQFIHESVRDFLLRDGGMQEVWPKELACDLDSKSHLKLWECCSNYLAVDLSDLPRTLPRGKAKLFWGQLISQFPFLQYAQQEVLYHAESTSSRCHHSIVQAFPLRKWIYAHNTLESHENRRFSDEANLTYILAANGYGKLLDTLNNQDAWVRLPQERYQFPVLAAFAGGHLDALRSLLADECVALLDDLYKDPGFGKASVCRTKQDPLTWAVSYKNWTLAVCLLISRSSDVSPAGKSHILAIAAKYGTQPVFELLSMARADALSHLEMAGHSYDILAQTLLTLTLGSGTDEIFDILYRALNEGRTTIVQILLDARADNHARQELLDSALLEAAAAHHGEKLVPMLLEAGADANA